MLLLFVFGKHRHLCIYVPANCSRCFPLLLQRSQVTQKQAIFHFACSCAIGAEHQSAMTALINFYLHWTATEPWTVCVAICRGNKRRNNLKMRFTCCKKMFYGDKHQRHSSRYVKIDFISERRRKNIFQWTMRRSCRCSFEFNYPLNIRDNKIEKNALISIVELIKTSAPVIDFERSSSPKKKNCSITHRLCKKIIQ